MNDYRIDLRGVKPLGRRALAVLIAEAVGVLFSLVVAYELVASVTP